MSIETETPPTPEVETDVDAVAENAVDANELKTNAADDIHPISRHFLFLGNEKVKRNFIWIPLIGMIICVILGILHPQKHPLPIEKYIPGSWAIYGFIAYSLIVLSASTLFRILGRDEDYYGEGGLPDPDYSTDPMITGEAHHD